jgi:hypothetical protein
MEGTKRSIKSIPTDVSYHVSDPVDTNTKSKSAGTQNFPKLRGFLRELRHPKESLLRVAWETTSWRLSVLLVITPVITLAVTHKWKFAAELSVVEVAVKYPVQILHGKIWSHLPWGYTKKHQRTERTQEKLKSADAVSKVFDLDSQTAKFLRTQ